jgi:hypothetical protein
LEKTKNGQGDRVVGLCLDVTATATSKNTTKSASATVNEEVPGLVTATANVQVAQ